MKGQLSYRMARRILLSLNNLWKGLDKNLLADIDSYLKYNYKGGEIIIKQFSPYNNLQGKCILDLGCGCGGKTASYALDGVKKIVGIDINITHLIYGREFVEKNNIKKVVFIGSNGERLPFKEDTFDMIISSSVGEHLENPLDVLLECYRVLKKEGLLLIRIHLFKSRYGAHLNYYINIPWCEFFFSEEVILSVWKELYERNYKLGKDTAYPYEEVQQAKSIHQLCHLNKLSIAQWEAIINKTQFKKVATTYLWGKKPIKNFIFKCIPFKGYIADYVTYVLQKNS